MSRRDFLKQLSVLTFASACAFKGGSLFANYSSENIDLKDKYEIKNKYEFDPFSGAKNSGFEFSVPLPLNLKAIDDLVEINKTYKKSKVVSLYNGLPMNSNELAGFVATPRGVNENIKSFDDLAVFIKYAQRRGFEFTYLINSPRAFLMNEFEQHKLKFDELLVNLKKIGVKNIKVANQQLLEVFKNINEFNVQASTSFEYTNIRQFQNLLKIYPKVKDLDLATDSNRNITFLRNMKKVFPNKTFELIADEPCIYACPARITHPSAGFDFIFPCNKFYDKDNKWKNFCRTSVIYPWNLDLYASIGIKNFKLVGNTYGRRFRMTSVRFVRDYFEAVENGVKDFSLNQFLSIIGIFPVYNDMKLSKEIIAALSNINYFIAHGDRCSSDCGATCNYCYECAEKLNKIANI